MGKKQENTGFICKKCGKDVLPLSSGGYRNHCPFCLNSLHLDNIPGDRQADCGGLMSPVSVKLTGNKGLQILHKCELCGFERLNMTSDDKIQPDNFDLILDLMRNA